MSQPQPAIAINRSMPSSTVIPVLGYPDVRAAVDRRRLADADERSPPRVDGGAPRVGVRAAAGLPAKAEAAGSSDPR